MSGGYRVGPEDDPDRYEIRAAVASGAEGILYRGTITTSGGLVLDVAVKMLQPWHRPQVGAWQARWSEQLELLRSLHVPGVVQMRDGFLGVLPHPVGETPPPGRNLYLVMNWVEGQALDQWVASRPQCDVLESLKLLIAVGAALDVMHSGLMTGGVPVVHRDVKPANILVTPGGSVLVDFGMTRGLPTGSRPSGVTGTPGYIAPESLASGVYSPASDRYALGCVAYFVITGTEPPRRPDQATMRANLAAAPALARLADRPQMIDLLMSMVADDPAHRPAHAANWLAGVRGSSLSELPLAPGEIAAGANPVVYRAGRNLSSVRPRARLVLALVPIGAVAALAFFLPLDGPDSRTPTVEVTDGTIGSIPSDEAVPDETTATSGPDPDAQPRAAAPATTTVTPIDPVLPAGTMPPTSAARPRATPVITARNESYEVEVFGEFQRYAADTMGGFVRRQDLKGVWGEGPDGYGAAFIFGWRGTYGPRCLAAGGSSGNLSVPGEPLHLYAYGVVGLDAVKVELVWEDGRRIDATLGNQTFSVPVRWWIATYDTLDPDQIVATDAAGSTWAVPKSAVGLFGQVGC